MSWLRGVGSAMALVVAAVFLVVGPSQAVGESVQVLTVDHAGCADGEYAIGIAIDVTEGGDPYVLRTLVTIGGLVYTNAENAITTDDPAAGWNLYNAFNYGAVANPGTWPMPSGQQMRVDFTLERPKGTVLAAWTLVTAGCNSATILYNGPPIVDGDNDGIFGAQDRCPSLASSRTNGCPLRERTLSISYSGTKHAFVGRLLAKGYAPLHARRPVIVYKVRGGPDLKLGKVITSARGTYSLPRGRKPGRYYAKSPGVIVASVGEAAPDVTRRIQL